MIDMVTDHKGLPVTEQDGDAAAAPPESTGDDVDLSQSDEASIAPSDEGSAPPPEEELAPETGEHSSEPEGGDEESDDAVAEGPEKPHHGGADEATDQEPK